MGAEWKSIQKRKDFVDAGEKQGYGKEANSQRKPNQPMSQFEVATSSPCHSMLALESLEPDASA